MAAVAKETYGQQKVRGRETLPERVILIARTPELPEAGVWPFGLMDPLPKIPITLATGEEEPVIDLKAVLDAVYNESAFADHITGMSRCRR